MIELTHEQRRELAHSNSNTLVQARDPVTNETYVLVRSEVYEQIKDFVDDDVRLMQQLLAELAPEDWEDASVYENQS